MKFKRQSSVFAVLSTLLTLLGCYFCGLSEVYALEVNKIADGKITIVASTPVPPTQEPSREAFRDLEDCGFNMFLYYLSPKEFRHILPMISGLDLKLLVANNALSREDSEKFASQYGNSPRLAGWDFVDEPRYADLDRLQKSYEILTEAYPDKLTYINLVGDNIPIFTGPSPDYNSYLDTIQKRFSPSIWSYDLYPLSVKDNKLSVAYDSFYSDLEVFSALSKKTGRPFWAYCQSMAFKNKVVERPVATLPYLRFEAFSALAYGAQGIVYWTYGQRENSKTEEYISALVNLDGQKTPAWYAARQVNKEIRALNEVFYNSALVDCRQTGDKLYRNTHRLSGSFGPIAGIVTGKDGVLVSHLKNDSGDYIVIVNRNPFSSQKVNLTFLNDYDIEQLDVVNYKGEFTIKHSRPERKVKKKLPAGGYLIFKYS